MNVSALSAGAAPAVSPLSDSLPRVTGTPEAQRRQVAAQFEAILVRQLLGKSVGSMLGGDDSVSGSVYGDMMTDVLARKLTDGGGLGLGRLIERQLTPRGPAVRPASAGAAPLTP